jgi:hypothetical protein
MSQYDISEVKRSEAQEGQEINGIVSNLRFVKALIAATASLLRDLCFFATSV